MAQYTNASDFCRAVREQIDIYIAFPKKKHEVIQWLKPFFEENADEWKMIIKRNKYTTTCHTILRATRIEILNELLKEIDPNNYEEISNEQWKSK